MRHLNGVSTMVDYDQHYQRCQAACGEPLQEVVDFFAALEYLRLTE